jgi:SDR family mycofactocin-dependent oxidoreductase
MHMPGRVEGKVAFITGAARGQGRSHAIRLAEEGADVIAVDILEDYPTVRYAMSSEADLGETVRAVQALGRRIVPAKADVRNAAALAAILDVGVAELGRLDIVCANAGIYTVQPWDQVTPQVWRDTIDTNLTGVWNTMVVAVPHLIRAGGGSIIATSSTAGLKGMPFLAPYVAAKHAVVGICRSLANELAGHGIRVNTVHPAGVDTPMVAGLESLEPFIRQNPELGALFSNSLPVDAIDPRDVSNAVLYLASDEARYVTGLELTVDAGNTIR